MFTASRVRLSVMGPRMLRLPFSSSPANRRLKEPHTERARPRVDARLLLLHPRPAWLAWVSRGAAQSRGGSARCFLPPPSIPSFSLPLLPALPPRRPRPLLGIPWLSVPPSILSAGN